MKTTQLLLTESIDNLGIVGDVVKVKPGYARNYLLPHGLATVPTSGNIKRLAERRAEVERQMREARVAQEAMMGRLENFEITIERSANEQGILFGGISQHDVAQALCAKGFNVDDRAIRIGSQIKRLDVYEIPVVLANDLKTHIKLWVVSDKPADELEAQGGSEAASQGEANPGEGAEV